jgi:hypothetical protein
MFSQNRVYPIVKLYKEILNQQDGLCFFQLSGPSAPILSLNNDGEQSLS